MAKYSANRSTKAGTVIFSQATSGYSNDASGSDKAESEELTNSRVAKFFLF